MSDKIHLELQLLNDGVYIHIWNGSKRFIRPEQWKLGEVKSYSGELECLEDLIFNFLNHKNTNKEETAKLAGWLGDLSEWVHTELKERYLEEELYLFNDSTVSPTAHGLSLNASCTGSTFICDHSPPPSNVSPPA